MSYRRELPNNYVEEDGYIISPPDRTLIIVTIFLVVIGVMAIFSAGSSKAVVAFILYGEAVCMADSGNCGCRFFYKIRL